MVYMVCKPQVAAKKQIFSVKCQPYFFVLISLNLMVYVICYLCLFQRFKEQKQVLNKIINHFHSFICSNTWEPALSLAQHKTEGIEKSKGHFPP